MLVKKKRKIRADAGKKRKVTGGDNGIQNEDSDEHIPTDAEEDDSAPPPRKQRKTRKTTNPLTQKRQHGTRNSRASGGFPTKEFIVSSDEDGSGDE